MTRVMLLENLKAFTLESTRDLLMPVKLSEEEEAPEPRAAGVHICHLPEFSSISRKAPCILHQTVTSKDVQHPGDPRPKSAAVVRSAFCVYNENEEEAGLDTVVYDAAGRPTRPYYLGEMISVWKLPYAMEREVPYGK